METTDDSSQLAQASEAGDLGKIDALLAEHRDYLLRVAHARMNPGLRRRIDASDVVQEAQAEAVRRVDQFLASPDLPVRLWLRRLVVERVIMAERMHLDARKRAVGREQHEDKTSQGLAKQLLAGEDSPSRIASARETSDRLRQSLAGLRDADREIIELHIFEGLTSQESAEVLQIEPAAARKRLGRALGRLRQILEQHDLGESRT